MMCNICGGDGTYPIIDMSGRERYSIRCPECFGSGMESEPDPAPVDLPMSTAAKIKTLDELNEYIATHWRS